MSGSASKPEGRALKLFEQSARVYRDGRFQEAVDLLLEARALTREPVLLYNLARAYEALGKLDEAIAAYSGYLEEEPRASDRGAIEGRMATMRRTLEEREALRRAQAAAPRRVALAAEPAREPSPPPPAAPPREAGLAPVPWIMAGVGVAAASTGVVFGLVSRARDDDAAREPVQQSAAHAHDQATGYATAANVAFVVGAVLGLAGGIWLLVRATGSSSAAANGALSSRAPVSLGGALFGGSF